MKITYVTLGTNDRAAAEKFYDSLLKNTHFQKVYSEDRMTMWVNDGFMFALATPFDGNPATVGNGSMVGFQVDSDADVDWLYKLALSLGESCEGKPGIRSSHQSAYVRDLDGNKICILA